MSTPESPASNGQVDLEALFARIDQNPHQSDPNHEVEAYFQVVQMGEAALASLLAAAQTMSRWQMRAVIDIAEIMEQRVDLPRPGSSHQEFLDAVLKWGEQNGYIAAEPPIE